MKRRVLPNWKVALAGLAALLLAGALWRLTRSDVRGQIMYTAPGPISSLQMSPEGTLTIFWDIPDQIDFRDGETWIDTTSGNVLREDTPHALSLANNQGRPMAFGRNGYRAAIVSTVEGTAKTGRCWLRIISPDGHQRDIQRICWPDAASDFRFTPDGRELLVLIPNMLLRYEVETDRAHIVTCGGVSVKARPKPWVNGDGPGFEARGASLSPDGNYIAGLTSSPAVYDAHTGKVVREFGLESPELSFSWTGMSFRTRWSDDGRTILAEAPYWLGLNLYSWPDGKLVKKHYERRPLPKSYLGPETIFSPTGRFLMDWESGQILLRDTATFDVVRRVRSPRMAAGWSPPMVISPTGDAIFTAGNLGNAASRDDRRSIWRWPTVAQ